MHYRIINHFFLFFRCSKFLRALLLNVDETGWAFDVGETIDVVIIWDTVDTDALDTEVLCFLLTPRASSEDQVTCTDVAIFVGADVEELEDDKLDTIDADAADATIDDDNVFAYQIK